MASFEDEIRDLKEKNTELVQEVQFWKITAAQREKEKIELMKELNNLRLKLSRLRSSGAAEARKLNLELQSAGKEAVSHLIQASGAVARGLDLANQFMRNTQELDLKVPRWSNLSGGTSPYSDSKVNKVPPMSIGGQSIQPVVALSRTLLNSSTRSRSPGQNTNVTERAVPMHMLQDVYIPLTRIDMADMQINSESEMDNSTDDVELQESSGTFEDSQNITEETNESRRLDDVIEEAEPEEEEQERRSNTYSARIENPLEGPSWLLDRQQTVNAQMSRRNLEPDSTTPCDQPTDDAEKENEPLSVTLTFTPTVRRRKRTSPPPAPLSPLGSSPRRHSRGSNENRVLKVVVAKMRLSDEQQGGSPPKMAKLISPRTIKTQRRSTIDSPSAGVRPPVASPRRPSESAQRDCGRARLVEPSPRGRTDAGVMVLTTHRHNNVTQRKRAVSSDSDVSDDDTNVSGNNIKATDNINVTDNGSNFSDSEISVSDHNSKVSENDVSLQNIRPNHNTAHENHDRNASERHNANRRDGNDGSELDDDVNEGSECENEVGNVNSSRKERDANDRNVKDDRAHRNASNRDASENEEEFRGFTKTTRNTRTERNVSDSHDKNKNVTKSRTKNVTNSRDKIVNVTKRNTSERHEANVTQRGNSQHDGSQMSEQNVSGRRNHKSVSKRYVSDRQDGNVSDSNITCQNHDVDSDTSNNDSDWGPGRARRNKKKVTYTEVPLNRKMRR